MKTLLIFLSAFWLAGCAQIVVEKDKLQINTFLTSSGFESFYYDPDGFLEVNKYQGVLSDIEFEYNPITNTFKAKVAK